MKKILLTLLLTGTLTAHGQSNIAIYRNDGSFNQIKLTEGENISHNQTGTVPTVEFNDWMKGRMSVGLARVDSCVMRRVDVPVLRFTLPDYPKATMLWEKELYLKANLAIEGSGLVEDVKEFELQIKGRGNSTWGMPKKPIRLKLSKKTSLCGLRKAKNFVLLNNYLDPSLMRNALALWLARRLEVPYANNLVPCHVFINNSYAGAYTLTEKVGINAGSVDINETEGMLFELGVEFDEPYRFRSKIGNLPVMVKDPDFDELYEDDPEGPTPTERLAAWEADFNAAEALVAEGRGAEAFDIESAVNYLMVYNLIRTNELNHPKSLYIHKRSLAPEEKYILGPAWDFDVGFNFLSPSGAGYSAAGATAKINVIPLLRQLMATDEFKTRYAERWKEFMDDMYDDFLAFFDEYASLIGPSARYDGLRWPTIGAYGGWAYKLTSFDFHTQAAALRTWLVNRITYLNKHQGLATN